MTLLLATPDDEGFLWEMLYEAVFTPPGRPRPSRNILLEPAIARYVTGWGRAGDTGVVAVHGDSGQAAGAAWFRRFPSDAPVYGFVNAETPELAMAVRPAFRGRGVGTSLLNALIEIGRSTHPGLSLSVDPENPARRLYERAGFKDHGSSGRTMLLDFGSTHPRR